MAGVLHFGRRLADALHWRRQALERRVALWRATRIKSGKSQIRLADDECCAVTLLKNGAYFLPALLAHHRGIGVRHFLIIDNGSTDGTQALLANEPDVTVVENRLPVSSYEILLRDLLPRRFVKGGWFLIVDSDEMFDPPPGCAGQIRPLLQYMTSQGQTALLAHCLDMFSDAPAAETARWAYEQALDQLTLYSLGNLERVDYRDPDLELAYYLRGNHIDAAVGFWVGGMRREVFGETPLLTRHNLFRNIPRGPRLQHVHAVKNAQVSEVTASFRHYKFTGDYIGRDRRQVAAAVWQHGEDVARLAMYDRPGGFAISTATNQIYTGVDALLDQSFIQTSERFQAFVAREGGSG